jgi:hypothetical protein
MSLFSRTSLALVLVLAAASIGAAVAGASGASDPAAQAARSCGSFRQGGVYVYNLRTRHVGCSKARKVARAFNNCRHRHGARGHCHHRVKHFKCRESRLQSSPAQYNSSVRCKRGGKRVKFGYTQNT